MNRKDGRIGSRPWKWDTGKKRAHGTSSYFSSQPSSALHPFNQKSQSHTKLETKKECLSLPSYPDKKKQKQQKFLKSRNRCKTAADQWLSKKILQKSSSRKLIIQQRKAKWGREREKEFDTEEEIARQWWRGSAKKQKTRLTRVKGEQQQQAKKLMPISKRKLLLQGIKHPLLRWHKIDTWLDC